MHFTWKYRTSLQLQNYCGGDWNKIIGVGVGAKAAKAAFQILAKIHVTYSVTYMLIVRKSKNFSVFST